MDMEEKEPFILPFPLVNNGMGTDLKTASFAISLFGIIYALVNLTFLRILSYWMCPTETLSPLAKWVLRCMNEFGIFMNVIFFIISGAMLSVLLLEILTPFQLKRLPKNQTISQRKLIMFLYAYAITLLVMGILNILLPIPVLNVGIVEDKCCTTYTELPKILIGILMYYFAAVIYSRAVELENSPESKLDPQEICNSLFKSNIPERILEDLILESKDRREFSPISTESTTNEGKLSEVEPKSDLVPNSAVESNSKDQFKSDVNVESKVKPKSIKKERRSSSKADNNNGNEKRSKIETKSEKPKAVKQSKCSKRNKIGVNHEKTSVNKKSREEVIKNDSSFISNIKNKFTKMYKHDRVKCTRCSTVKRKNKDDSSTSDSRVYQPQETSILK